mmetsp:Transcript_9229/g.19925  ORF Transcript_9229/g.19925 Transcript_9229/m.19925 type:complete len:302 (-) Transcript_9229:123-1028(-)
MAKDIITALLIAISCSSRNSCCIRGGLSLVSAFSYSTMCPSPLQYQRAGPPISSRSYLHCADSYSSAFKRQTTIISRINSRIAVASSAPERQQNTSKDVSTTKRKISLHVWIALMSAFIMTNAKFQPYPESLLYALSSRQWAFVHAVCSMIFSGTIILSALMEYLVIASGKESVIKFWFLSVPAQLDERVVLPALAGAIVSGVGQAAINYGSLATSPKHIVGAFHLLLTFGLWWGITDVTTQRKAVKAVQQMKEDERDSSNDDSIVEIPKVLKMRVSGNIVSCILVVVMYALMVLKPGFSI